MNVSLGGSVGSIINQSIAVLSLSNWRENKRMMLTATEKAIHTNPSNKNELVTEKKEQKDRKKLTDERKTLENNIQENEHHLPLGFPH